MTVGRSLLQVSSIQPQSAMAKLLQRLVSIVLILVSISVTQVSTERVARATELTCAEGGTCEVGDTGPGGGKVFYVAETLFTSTGSDCDNACRYLEAAPSEARITWASRANRLTSVPGTSYVIGSGMANTKKIFNQSGS